MRIGSWAGLMAAAALLGGCGDFWQAPSTSSTTGFSLSNSGSIEVTSSSTNTDTITVTPGSSFTGTVSLTCSVATPSGDSSSGDPTCSLSPTSLTFSSTSSSTSTLTATAGSVNGAYQVTVTGVSGSGTSAVAATTTFCVAVGESTSNCSSTATTSGNFYVLSNTQLAGYSVNSSNITAISGSSYTLTGATAMAVDPSGYIWVATNGQITSYKITSTGALTQGTAISAFEDLNGVGALQVDPSGKWLLDASLGGNLFALPIASGGQDTSRSIQSNTQLSAASIATNGIAISKSSSTNPIVAVALKSGGTDVFPFTAGAASPIQSRYNNFGTIGPAVSSAAESVAIDPSNGFLYIGETNANISSTSGDSGAIRLLTIGSGSSLVTSTAQYASGGNTPYAILADSNGYVYVANWNGTSAGVITPFLLTAATPSLKVQTNTVTTGAEPFGMVLDSTGDFVLTANNYSSPYINAFTLSSGTLSSSTSSSAVSNPIAIVAAP